MNEAYNINAVLYKTSLNLASERFVQKCSKFLFEKANQSLTNFTLQFIRQKSETESSRSTGCLEFCIDGTRFLMEVVSNRFFDFSMKIWVLFDLVSNVCFELILDDVFERFDDQIFRGHQILNTFSDATCE